MDNLSARAACLVLAGLCLLGTQTGVHAGEIAGTIRGPDGRGLANAVVFVAGVRAGSPPRRPALMDQRRRKFLPPVLVVQLGTTVRFPNNDTVYHNVFSYREGKRFDLGLYPVGSTRSVTFDKPGLSRLFCNIHSTMSAYIWVVENPYFDQTTANGTYRIRGVPPGRYTLQFWHPRAGETTRQVTVGAGETRLEVALNEL